MKIILTEYAHQKLQAYVKNCQYEIGGLGKVTCDGEDFLVTDIEIFTQKVTAASVEMNADTLALFQVEKMKAKESLADYKLWWHSHAKMDVFWSSTDTDTMTGSTEFPWLVSLVTNHAGKLKARVDVMKPVHLHVDNVTVEIQKHVDQSIIDSCIAEIAAKVTVPKIETSKMYLGYENQHRASQFVLPMKKTLDANDKQTRFDTLSANLFDLEMEYQDLSVMPKTPKRDARMAKLTKCMDNIERQLDLITG